MVIPWVGYSLAELIRRVEPTGNAKFVEFVTLADKAQMPGLRSPVLDWPYVEGLRLDEAMHPLTLLAFGLYGEVLPNQNGAPVRLVVPWKYGFKSGKSIVSIRFVEKQPKTSWEKAARQRVRLLFQRQPEGRPPALEPGHRAPHRRGRPVREEAPDADVQRLRSPGRPALRRHGPEEVLLIAPHRASDPRARHESAACCTAPTKPLLFVLALLPFAWLLLRRVGRQPGRQPGRGADPRHRRLDAALPVPDAGRDAAAPAGPAGARWRACGACSACSPSSTACCTSCAYAWLDMGFDLADIVTRHPQAPVHPGRHAGAAADAAAGGHLVQPRHQGAGRDALAGCCTGSSTRSCCSGCCTSSGCARPRTTSARSRSTPRSSRCCSAGGCGTPGDARRAGGRSRAARQATS